MKKFRYVLAGICFIIFLWIMYSVLKYDSLSIDTSVYNFISNNIDIDGVEVYITPHNYKELQQAIEESIQNIVEEELE